MKLTALLFCILCVSVTYADVRSALEQLYDATDGSNWTINYGWKTDPDVCSWAGITCASTKVVQLDLSRNKLSGAIPDSISELSDLKYLNMRFNAVTQIPSSISKLKKLEQLLLEFNLLKSFPFDEVAELSKLQVLQLNDNSIDGTLPSKIGNMEALTNFTANFNRIHGSIPDSIAELSNLQEMQLEGNLISGEIPSGLTNMKNLQGLWLGANDLSGSIPQFSSNTLISLSLRDNHLTGSIPTSLGNMQNLQYLDLSGNDLEGEIPSELGNCGALWFLSLGYNSFGGLIPTSLGNLKQLKRLFLRNNPFTPDAFPSWLYDIPIYDIYMNNTQRTGTLPSDMGKKLFAISTIELGYNHFTGAFPGGWEGILDMSFEYNTFSGKCPPIEAELEYCDLSNIPFSCPLPKGIREKCNAYCE